MKNAKPAIIVISSHVVRGTVGNRIMVPVLEELGYDVWAVPTTILPFHPGHGKANPIIADDEAFAGLLDELAVRSDLSRVVAIISGYLGSARQADAIGQLVLKVKSATAAIYVCDPVIGERSGLYVSEAIAVAQRDVLVPIADVITPNRYEHDWLTGQSSITQSNWIAASAHLVAPLQIVTSVPDNDDQRIIGNLMVPRSSPADAVFAGHRHFESVPSGTGDLFTGSFTGLLATPGAAPRWALETATNKVLKTIVATQLTANPDLNLQSGFENDPAMVQVRGQQAFWRAQE